MSSDNKITIGKLDEGGYSAQKGFIPATVHTFRLRNSVGNKQLCGRPRTSSNRTETERRKNLKDLTYILNEKTS